MERLWAPWRMEYLNNEKGTGCIFCLPSAADDDRDRLVLHRTPCSLVMLNRYPYTNGHLLIAPLRHTAEMNDLSDAEMLDLFATVRICRDILQATAHPDGYNIGMNLGHAAGAGVEDHLHLHIVPRWSGDTNFMSVIPDVRVMPEDLLTTYDRLLPALLARLNGADR
jgi:ATP adenylyltransferase